ncbi:hypothetical protein [Specibacter sp. RAF43]|uniref:hypothetical protein n=1 Tax=Specibacter sp. RAF43 TaxID=3233057 RepID=UPI003F95420F
MRTKLVKSALGVLVLVSGMLLIGPATGGLNPADAAALGAHQQIHRSTSLDTASSAIPTAGQPTVTDSAQSTVRTASATSKATAVAVATSNCDGCSGVSTTFQVVYFDGRAASADNSAAAWSSCAGCASSAVSVQLVVARRATQLTMNNRALALNADCTGCATTSAAIQFVISGGTRRDLSAQAKDMITQIQGELAQRLQATPQRQGLQRSAPQAKSLTDDTASRLAQIILKDVGAATVQRNIDVQSGQ